MEEFALGERITELLQLISDKFLDGHAMKTGKLEDKPDAYQIACTYGLAATDALHVAAALWLKADELIKLVIL